MLADMAVADVDNTVGHIGNVGNIRDKASARLNCSEHRRMFVA
jgi:hypothetical protein